MSNQTNHRVRKQSASPSTSVKSGPIKATKSFSLVQQHNQDSSSKQLRRDDSPSPAASKQLESGNTILVKQSTETNEPDIISPIASPNSSSTSEAFESLASHSPAGFLPSQPATCHQSTQTPANWDTQILHKQHKRSSSTGSCASEVVHSRSPKNMKDSRSFPVPVIGRANPTSPLTMQNKIVGPASGGGVVTPSFSPLGYAASTSGRNLYRRQPSSVEGPNQEIQQAMKDIFSGTTEDHMYRSRDIPDGHHAPIRDLLYSAPGVCSPPHHSTILPQPTDTSSTSTSSPHSIPSMSPAAGAPPTTTTSAPHFALSPTAALSHTLGLTPPVRSRSVDTQTPSVHTIADEYAGMEEALSRSRKTSECEMADMVSGLSMSLSRNSDLCSSGLGSPLIMDLISNTSGLLASAVSPSGKENSPITDKASNDSPGLKVAASPKPNKSFEFNRDPPDGCERIRTITEEPRSFISSDEQRVHCAIKQSSALCHIPSRHSAFCEINK